MKLPALVCSTWLHHNVGIIAGTRSRLARLGLRGLVPPRPSSSFLHRHVGHAQTGCCSGLVLEGKKNGEKREGHGGEGARGCKWELDLKSQLNLKVLRSTGVDISNGILKSSLLPSNRNRTFGTVNSNPKSTMIWNEVQRRRICTTLPTLLYSIPTSTAIPFQTSPPYTPPISTPLNSQPQRMTTTKRECSPSPSAQKPISDKPHVQNTDLPSHSLSLSLAASQAVRLSLIQGGGNIADAFRVVNAVRLGRFEEHSSSPWPLSSIGITTQGAGTDVLDTLLDSSSMNNGRLPTHALLHGLIRLDRPQEATRLAEQMMKAGMRVRSRSIERLLGLLAATTTTTTTTSSVERGSSLINNLDSNLNQIQSRAATGTTTTASTLTLAHTLLETARQTRTRRTHRMIKTLLALALLNGEIVLASLIFGGLVREWRGKKMREDQTEGLEVETGHGKTMVMKNFSEAKRRRQPFPLSPVPALSNLVEICGYVDESVGRMMLMDPALASTCSKKANYSGVYHHEKDPVLWRLKKPPDRVSDDSSIDEDDRAEAERECKLEFSKSLQALANVVGALMDGDVGRCAGSGNRSGEKRMDGRVDQNSNREVQKLPLPPPVHPVGNLAGLVKVLYRSLVCLEPEKHNNRKRERVWIRDPKTGLAKMVEARKYLRQAMKRFIDRLPKCKTQGQGRTLSPGTYNTLLYYALVHARSREMADGVLESMMVFWRVDDVTRNIVEGEAGRSRKRVKGKRTREVEEMKAWAEKWKAKFNGGEDEDVLSVAGLVKASSKMDLYTLSTRIRRCVASGKPEVVAEAVPHLLPGTAEEAVKKAVGYGPIVLTSLLSALMKAGRTGLAGQVWKVMRAAERASWNLETYLEQEKKKIIVVTPWCLAIEAYSVMIQVYARKKSHLAMKVFRLVGPEERDLVQRRIKSLEAVIGDWMDTAKTNPDIPKIKLAMDPKHLRPPVPDPHFFNSILDVVSRSHNARPRSTRCLTRKKARTRFLTKVRTYIWEGRVLGYGEPDSRLREFVRRMREAGLGERVPLHVRRILVGKGEDVEGGGVGTGGKVWVE